MTLGGIPVTNYPRKDRDARTGSNLLGEPVLAHRKAQLAREAQVHERLAKEYFRQSKKLFSKRDLRRAAAIAAQANREWRKASIEAGSESTRIDGLKLTVRRKMERALAREAGNYRQWKTIQRSHLRDQNKARTTTMVSSIPGAVIDWGDVLTVDPGSAQEFTAPFTTFDVQPID